MSKSFGLYGMALLPRVRTLQSWVAPHRKLHILSLCRHFPPTSGFHTKFHLAAFARSRAYTFARA